MSPEQIMAHSSKALAALLPDVPHSEIKKMRHRAKNTLWQRKYRADGRDVPKGDYSGPAIHHCPTQERLIANAREASARLALAIEQAGLRP